MPYFFACKTGVFSFQNNPKNLDLSYKTDLDLWDCLGRVTQRLGSQVYACELLTAVREKNAGLGP